MNYRHSSRRHDSAGRYLNSAQNDHFDNRFSGMFLGTVTRNDDPDRQRRVKARIQFQHENGVAMMQTGWLWQISTSTGPHDMRRGRRYGFDYPLPEVGAPIRVEFNCGNRYDGYYWGQPRYWEGNTGAPELEKDKHPDWCFRFALQNGWEWGVDTDGNEYIVTPGNFRHKIQCDGFVSARGTLDNLGTEVRLHALAVMRRIAPTLDETNYPRAEEHLAVREMIIDAMAGPPGRKDPGIGKIEDLEG